MTDYIIGIVLMIALLGVCYRFARPYFHSYMRQRDYRRILKAVGAFYKHGNPYLIAKEARKNDPDDSLIYGEIDICALLDLLDYIKPTEKDVFYDLGSGAGKTLMATQMRYPYLKVCGIERLQGLHDLAEEIGQSHPPPHPLFINDDFLNVDFSEATILLINATAFSPATWEPMLAKLAQLKSGTKVIVTSKTLPPPGFIARFGAMEKMSWGLCTTRIYEKV